MDLEERLNSSTEILFECCSANVILDLQAWGPPDRYDRPVARTATHNEGGTDNFVCSFNAIYTATAVIHRGRGTVDFSPGRQFYVLLPARTMFALIRRFR